MFKADYHVHSNFSGDSGELMENILTRAKELSLDEIAITDHLDPDYPNVEINFDLDLPAYIARLEEITRDQNGERPLIKKGIEIGMQKHLAVELAPVTRSGIFDFVIGSIHCADGGDFAEGGFFEGHSKDEAHRIYFETFYENLKVFDGISVLGHLDFIKRYGNKNYGKSFCELDYEIHMDIIEEILRLAIDNGTGLEVNTSGFRYGLGHAHPHKRILALYRELGGEIITTGSDAHSANQLGEYFREALELLSDLGFRYVCAFENKVPIFHRIGL